MDFGYQLQNTLEILKRPFPVEKRNNYSNFSATNGFHKYLCLWLDKAISITPNGELKKDLLRARSLSVDYGKVSSEERKRRFAEIETIIERIESFLRLEMSVRFVKGVGPKMAQTLRKVGVEKVEDILYYFPRRYEDRRNFQPISGIRPGCLETVRGKVLGMGVEKLRPNLTIFKLAVDDGTGVLYGVWFNQPYLEKVFSPHMEVILSGKVTVFRHLQMENPEYEILDSPASVEDLVHTGRIVPIYPLTDRLSQRTLRTIMKRVVENFTPFVSETLPPEILTRQGLVPLPQALRNIHFPEDEKSKEEARRRLVFEEFFLLQLGILRRKGSYFIAPPRRKKVLTGELVERLWKSLPFSLTSAQKRAFAEIKEDMATSSRMKRLLQGDVGSGKTVVAVSALLLAVEEGKQGALMVPTGVLAEQHYLTLQKWLLPLGVKVVLLVGEMSKGEKDSIQREIASGETQIIIGTHTLIQENIQFHNLGLVVIDEQHRFGVRQRESLGEKGFSPHLLLMTATPIPRTLALTVYGDLGVSVLDEKPPIKSSVSTYWIPKERRAQVYGFVKEEVRRGHQVFVISPAIETSRNGEITPLTELVDFLKRTFSPKYRVGVLHGQLPPQEKEKVMEDFRKGEIKILASTTVVEVGVDIPQATVMVVEDAHRFGLAQLHQLRGRVGRGGYASYCLLLGDPKTPEAEGRLRTLVETEDGFEVAEKDLELRGPGEFLGLRQHGLPELRIGNIITDIQLLERARQEALLVLRRDPQLKGEVYQQIKRTLARRYKIEKEEGP